jgi:2,3-bisphosphoglycerate-dependent phosphoglycerate mutase
MPNLVIIRHGQSVFNKENRFTGSTDVDLSDLGRSEAQSAAEKLQRERYNFQYAFVSTLRRAKETLSIILNCIDPSGLIEIKESAALNERNYGELQGLNKDETAKKYSAELVHEWRRSFTAKPPGGESLSETYNRVIPYYQSSIQPILASDHNALIVAHGNSLRALMMMLEKIGPEQISDVEIATAIPRVYRLDLSLSVKDVKYL